MKKILISPNPLILEKIIRKNQEILVKRIESISNRKPADANGSDDRSSTHSRMNNNKNNYKKERQANAIREKIQKENTILLERMLAIASKKGIIGEQIKSENGVTRESMNIQMRRREIKHIEDENKIIANRLLSIKPMYDTSTGYSKYVTSYRKQRKKKLSQTKKKPMPLEIALKEHKNGFFPSPPKEKQKKSKGPRSKIFLDKENNVNLAKVKEEQKEVNLESITTPDPNVQNLIDNPKKKINATRDGIKVLSCNEMDGDSAHYTKAAEEDKIILRVGRKLVFPVSGTSSKKKSIYFLVVVKKNNASYYEFNVTRVPMVSNQYVIVPLILHRSDLKSIAGISEFDSIEENKASLTHLISCIQIGGSNVNKDGLVNFSLYIDNK